MYPLASLPRLPGWYRAVLCGLAVWGAGGLRPVSAQPPPPCEPLLAAAEARYVNREFAEAETLVRACLAQPESDEEALHAYRLLALVFIRQDDLSEAKQAILRLLGVSFEYEPDPVQDPPAYVALVTSIKEQLRIEEERLPPPDSARATPPAPAVVEPEPEPEPIVAPSGGSFQQGTAPHG